MNSTAAQPGGHGGHSPPCLLLPDGEDRARGATLSVCGELKGCRASWGQRTQGGRQSGSLPAPVMPLRLSCACASGNLPDTLSLTQQAEVNRRFCLSHRPQVVSGKRAQPLGGRGMGRTLSPAWVSVRVRPRYRHRGCEPGFPVSHRVKVYGFGGVETAIPAN